MAVTAAALAAVLAVGGCSSGGGPGEDPKVSAERAAKEKAEREREEKAEREARAERERIEKDRAAMTAVAVKFRTAVNAHDGRTACPLKTVEGRYGDSLEKCHDFYKPPGGRKPDTEQRTKVTVTGGPVTVPPFENHPGGTGLMVTQETPGDGGRVHVKRDALRMVKVDGAWLVDQDKEVLDSEMSDPSPVRSALTRP
ncbi:hypothetical protein SMD11_3558 [Streptomyces albireticuli]|uniref:Uncharacterized protein n=1 Tax=Streptomyces albireticuli TaxID=1940 RepID=A0A1Z2L4P8_9ACTN|nr:hypothetical protein SMD11_3558 [Streptomyces albireticuli]